MVSCPWKLQCIENDGNAVEIVFGFTESNPPFDIGISFLRHANTYNRQGPRAIRFSRPEDDGARTMFRYIAEDRIRNERLRLEVVPNRTSPHPSLLACNCTPDPVDIVVK